MADWTGRLSVPTIAVLFAIAGCGGDKDDEEARQVAEQYIEALNTGDTRRACELQIASTRKGVDCTLYSKGKVVPKSPEVEELKTTGETAAVPVTGSGGSVTLNLVKEDKDWKVIAYRGQPR